MAERPEVTVIICTHNPRPEYLTRVLAALRAQTLPAVDWELIVVDNASSVPVAGRFDLTWHPHGRHVREDELGLTPARLRGIAEARGRLLVFVDDDNVLDPDYLEHALRIAGECPFLGAWAGQAVGEFERPPSPALRPYLSWIAVREFERDQWANFPYSTDATPNGAGLCVRETVAKQYAALVRANPLRKMLGRSGASLFGSEDRDLALTACDLGLGTGQFVALRLTHLIPAERVDEGYIRRLVRGGRTSNAILRYIREGVVPDPQAWWPRVVLRVIRERQKTPFERGMAAAFRRGERDAIEIIRRLHALSAGGKRGSRDQGAV